MALEVALRVAPSTPLNQVTDFIAEVEETGFAGVAIPDSQLLTRDTYRIFSATRQGWSHWHA